MRSEPLPPVLLCVFAFSAGEAIFRAEQSRAAHCIPHLGGVGVYMRTRRVMFVRDLFVDEITDYELRHSVASDEVENRRRNPNGIRTRCREYVAVLEEGKA